MGADDDRTARMRPMGRTLSPLGRQAGVAVIPWYLAGGVAAASCIAAYQPKGAADLAASYINLANPGTYNAAPGVAPSWAAATGWTFSGTEYLVSSAPTGAKPRTFIVRIDFSNLGTRTMIASSGDSGLQFRLDGRFPQLLSQSTAMLAASTRTVTGDKVAAVSYSATGVCTFYIDGVGEAPTTNNVTLTARTLFIGMHRSFVEYFIGKILGLAIYSDVLSAAQIAAVTSAMQAL